MVLLYGLKEINPPESFVALYSNVGLKVQTFLPTIGVIKVKSSNPLYPFLMTVYGEEGGTTEIIKIYMNLSFSCTDKDPATCMFQIVNLSFFGLELPVTILQCAVYTIYVHSTTATFFLLYKNIN